MEKLENDKISTQNKGRFDDVLIYNHHIRKRQANEKKEITLYRLTNKTSCTFI